MKLGDLTSIFQLGVALNLGYGVVASFIEPTKKHRDRFIYETESRLLVLGKRQESGQAEEEEIEDFFFISQQYRALYSRELLLKIEAKFSSSLVPRASFLVIAVASFGGLIVCSTFADFSHNTTAIVMLIAGIVINFAPFFAAALLFGASCWYEYKVMPIISEIEIRLRKYSTFY